MFLSLPTRLRLRKIRTSCTIEALPVSTSRVGLDGMRRARLVHLTLRNGVIITDPDDPTTTHSCRPGNALLVGKMLANRYMLEVGTQIRENRKRPRQAFDDAVCSVGKTFGDHSSEIRDGIKSELSTHYGYASKRTALSRNMHFSVIRGNCLDAILPELQKTKDGHRFLQFEDKTEARSMLVFFAEKDMDALCDAQCVLGDGNYKYNPIELYKPGQLYTLHAAVKEEAQPVVLALMQWCDTRAYETFLKVDKNARERKFGNVETLSTTAA